MYGSRKMASWCIIPCDMAIVECHFLCKCAEERYQIHLTQPKFFIQLCCLYNNFCTDTQKYTINCHRPCKKHGCLETLLLVVLIPQDIEMPQWISMLTNRICMFQVLMGCVLEGRGNGDREEVFARIDQGSFGLIINLHFMKVDNVK